MYRFVKENFSGDMSKLIQWKTEAYIFLLSPSQKQQVVIA